MLKLLYFKGFPQTLNGILKFFEKEKAKYFANESKFK